MFTISAKEHFPYDPLSTESKFFKLPLEIRQAIYLYAFHTPNSMFNKTVRGWREAPKVEDINRRINGSALLQTNKRIREEALPIYYKHSNFQVESWYMLRSFMNSTIAADSSHLFLRKISIVPWSTHLASTEVFFLNYSKHGQRVIELLAGLPSLRHLELSEKFMPVAREEFEQDEWLTLMGNLTANEGVLRIVAASLLSMWQWNAALDLFGWDGRVLAMTSIDVRTWNELVSIPARGGPDLDENQAMPIFELIYEQAMLVCLADETMTVTVQHLGREYKVKFWGVPEKVRQSEARRAMRKAIKEENLHKRKMELSRRKKGLDVTVDLGLDDSEEGDLGFGEESWRSGKAKTREDARAQRMERKVISARSKD